MNGIIWLASYPKSGNTWLRVFIENLFRNTIKPAGINDLKVVKYGDTMYSLYERVAGRKLAGASDGEFHRLRGPVQKFLASQPETTIVKTHNALTTHEGMPLIYLEYAAGAVYVLRNPFDMVVSMAHHYRTSYDDAIRGIASPNHHTPTTQAAIFQILGGWTNHYRSWFGVENFSPLLLRYEDMVHDPRKVFGRFMRYLGLPKNPERLKRAIRNSSFKEVERQEREGGFKERVHADHKFFRAGGVGRYRDVLDAEQVGRIIDAHGDLLIEQGYINKSGHPRV